MYGFVATYPFFLVAMVIITIGEMIVSPTSTALVARLAPLEMRGRYMAVSGFSWIIPSAIGPLLAGLIMDNYDPRWLWYVCGILAAIATLGFVVFHRQASSRLQMLDDRIMKIVPNPLHIQLLIGYIHPVLSDKRDDFLVKLF